VGPGTGVHLHTAHHLRCGLVGAGARHLRRQRRRDVGPAGDRVHVPCGPVTDGADRGRLPAVWPGRRAHHAQVGGEGDAQTAAHAQPDREQQSQTECLACAQHSLADEHRPEGRGEGEDDSAGEKIETHLINDTAHSTIVILRLINVVKVVFSCPKSYNR